MEYMALFILLAIAGGFCTGCIWLAVPSLAYEAYEYEHKLKSNPSSDANHNSSTEQQSSPNGGSDHSIE
jgi:hypothetical protein